MEDLYHPALIEEWKQNLDAAAYENNLNQDVNMPSIKKRFFVLIKMNTGQQAYRKVSIGYLFISCSSL